METLSATMEKNATSKPSNYKLQELRDLTSLLISNKLLREEETTTSAKEG
jgi:hypothetical protein